MSGRARQAISRVSEQALFARLGRDARGPDHVSPMLFDASQLDPELKAKLGLKQPKIRCPICIWEPKKRDKWSCTPMGAPEHFSGGCGKVWHTFDTRGLCPGCKHQWLYTTCLRCGATSLHEDWYEKKDSNPE
jgi:hypothetical protein